VVALLNDMTQMTSENKCNKEFLINKSIQTFEK